MQETKENRVRGHGQVGSGVGSPNRRLGSTYAQEDQVMYASSCVLRASMPCDAATISITATVTDGSAIDRQSDGGAISKDNSPGRPRASPPMHTSSTCTAASPYRCRMNPECAAPLASKASSPLVQDLLLPIHDGYAPVPFPETTSSPRAGRVRAGVERDSPVMRQLLVQTPMRAFHVGLPSLMVGTRSCVISDECRLAPART